jgi:hypothetical protein
LARAIQLGALTSAPSTTRCGDGASDFGREGAVSFGGEPFELGSLVTADPTAQRDLGIVCRRHVY